MMTTAQQRKQRKTRKGVVVSCKMDKTVVVKVTRTLRHAVYSKVIDRDRKFYAHDESNACKEGDVVTIMETRPMSKLKRWRVTTEE